MHRVNRKASIAAENKRFAGYFCLFIGLLAFIFFLIAQDVILYFGDVEPFVACGLIPFGFLLAIGIWLVVAGGKSPDPNACPRCGYDLRGDLAAGCPGCVWGRAEKSD